MGIEHSVADGIVEIVIDVPPVNAPKIAHWFELAELFTTYGRDPSTRVVVLRAEGRGFNAGIDIKEVQALPGNEGIIGVNRGCFAAFKAVYDCEVPTIAAPHGYVLGGGIGLVGASDIIVASEDAYFGLPEVDRGALGGATHLARMVPQHVMRAMFFTGENVTAQQLQHYGSVHKVVPKDELRDAALEVARTIAAKHPRVIRAAKEALNGIDPVSPHNSYRYEQGFTFELNLAGVGDELREDFVTKRERS
jgi:enoyl-CoA hydratase/carnithine racemase